MHLQGRGATVAKRSRELSAHDYGNRRYKMQTLWTPEDDNDSYNAIHAPAVQVSTETALLQSDIKSVLFLFALWRKFMRCHRFITYAIATDWYFCRSAYSPAQNFFNYHYVA